MTLKPYEWNTVIVGSWNPAILTPKGIADILFQKAKDQPIQVMVPLDGMAPPRVIIDETIVTVEQGRLVIEPKKPTWDSIEQSRIAALRAIEGLPRTPFNGVGFNVRYRLENPSDGFIRLFETQLDNSLSDATIKIMNRETRRSLEFKDGQINLYIASTDSNTYMVLMNFDKQTTQTSDLVKWLKVEIADSKEIVNKILYEVLKINKEEIQE